MRWLGAYLAQCAVRDPRLRIPPFDDFSPGMPGLGPWWRKYRPDVIIALGAALRPEFDRAGLLIPEETGLVVLDLPIATQMDLAGIVEDFAQVGANAVDVVDGLLKRNERGIPSSQMTIMTPGAWRPGSTVRPASDPGPARATR